MWKIFSQSFNALAALRPDVCPKPSPSGKALGKPYIPNHYFDYDQERMILFMNKTWIALFLAAVIALGLLGCTPASNTPAPSDIPTPTDTSQNSDPSASKEPSQDPDAPGILDDMTPTDSTSSTEPSNESSSSPTTPEDTKPEDTKPEDTKPEDTKPEDTTPPETGSGITEFEWYIALSGEEQLAFYNTFPSAKEFMEWYNAAKAEYDALHPTETVPNDGNVDLGGGN